MNALTRITNAMNIEGMTTNPGLALMDIFISKATVNCPTGDFVEFGTYKGRTCALFAQHVGESRTLHAIEQSDYLEIEKIKALSSRVIWHKAKSEAFCENTMPELVHNNKICATHHDASHFFDNVHFELSHIEPHMHKAGVIILDDFNDVFSQVRAAYYHLRYAKSFPWEVLVIGFNKCILVHETLFDSYERYVLNDFLKDLATANLDCKLYRSDINRHSRGFSIFKKKDPTEETYYGQSFWGNRFYQSSNEYLAKQS